MTQAPADRPPLKIACAIASRGRPAALIGVIAAAHRLQSGRNFIAFTVAVDDDDGATLEALDLIKRDGELPVIPVPAPRAPYLGAAQNRAIQKASDADLVTLLSDRTFVITPGWDHAIADAAFRHPSRVLWWSCPHDMDTTLPIIPHNLLDIVDWQWSPEVFPYWYDDTWWAEIDRMVWQGPSLRVQPAFAGIRGPTTRGREFEFWAKVWIALRPERIRRAKMIAGKLGVTWADPSPDMMADFTERDAHLVANAARFEEAFGAKIDPGPEYFEAKAKAERLLKEIGD